ncbi:sigma-54-dependent Fis family transcriptional regulator [candidate division KSB3 bacterium]|uniref:Sigma-54-dependent Fis family transcriptional regulator n=1 Tax=candidate division KSB3 bacterium TaxID=2044937 RepID=A0A2G6KGF1_9BACT|nr:MAG: sigma-54-dependent Fis family transcriptional regulator [candidate division KSB3 bacterium]
MKYSVGFIAPYPELASLFADVCQELQRSIRIEVGDLEDGAHQALRMEEQGMDVVISRGGTAIAIKETVTDLPVVEVQVSGFDIIRALYKARQQASKIAIVGFEPFTYEPDDLGEMLGLELIVISLKALWYDQPHYIEEELRHIQKQGYTCIVGDNISVNVAQQLGMCGHLITSGKEALIQAILEAERVAVVRQQEIEKARRAKSIIQFAYEGIISIDRDGMIDIFNPTAEDIFSRKAYKMLGKHIEDVLPAVGLSQALRTGFQEREKMLILGETNVLANIIPIQVNEQIVRVVATFQKTSHIQRMEQKIREEFYLKGHTAEHRFQDIIGQTHTIRQVKEEARDYAQIDLPILIYGETGTGKELFAQAIHNASARRNKPFVAFNCAALPEHLLESELFGYVEGAFTGAVKKGRAGLFEQAHGGTIFLDEIGEIPTGIQARLLRVLQESKIRRLGDDRVTPVDVRIIAATNKKLAQLVDEGSFRNDLYYRINVLQLTIPALRQRQEDLPVLIDFFLKKYAQRINKIVKGVSRTGMNLLLDYDWPGNVRQLENIVERLMVRTKERYIMAGPVREVMQSLRAYVDSGGQQRPLQPAPDESGFRLPPKASLAELEKMIIRQVLHEERGNKGAAAERLNIGRTTLWRKLKD